MSSLLQDLRDQAASEAPDLHAELVSADSDISLKVCCECGEDGEVSGYEIQFLRCRACGQLYFLSPFVSLIALSDDLIKDAHQVVTTV